MSDDRVFTLPNGKPWSVPVWLVEKIRAEGRRDGEARVVGLVSDFLSVDDLDWLLAELEEGGGDGS